FDDLDRVARSGADSLDEFRAGFLLRDRLIAWRSAWTDPRSAAALLFGRAFRRMEDGDLADVRFAEVLADAIDEDALPDIERRLHRATGDPVRLDDPGLDAKRETESDENDHDQLDDRADGRFRPFAATFHAGSSLPASFPSVSAPGAPSSLGMPSPACSGAEST